MTIESIRTLGSISSFFMWIKVFYWMRLFKNSAIFVTLIVSTLSDLRTFLMVVLIILLAFANFFYILNLNTPASETFKKRL